MNNNAIPFFTHLYGQIDTSQTPDTLHSEQLEQRSAFHDWTIKPHRHEQLVQIFAVLEGGGEAIIDGRSIQFDAPFIIFVPSLTVHGFQYQSDSSGFVLSAFKDEVIDCLNTLPQLMPMFNQSLSVALDNNEKHIRRALDLINDFHNEYRSNKQGRTLALRSLLSLILVTLSRCNTKANISASINDLQDQEKVAVLMDIVEDNFIKQHSTQFYADAMNMTPTKLRHVTQSILGISVHQIIINKLILEAKRNILYTSMSASQISEMLGFKDPAYFSRFFKKHTGKAPSVYRQEN